MIDPEVTPPKSVLRFLAWFCPPDLYEGIEGDLVEQFDEEVKVFGVSAARRRFLGNTLKFFRPGIIFRNRFSNDSINISMFKSYVTITFRNLLRNKGYSFINIFGLSLGIAVCLFTFNYVQFESSYDNFHTDIDRMYRVNQTNIWDPRGGVFHSTGPAVSIALKEDYQEIEEIMRVNTPGGQTIRYVQRDGNVLAFNEERVLAADSNFFSFFDFKLIEGDRRSALIGKDHVVLSEETARKLFGDEPALGKIIQVGDERTAVEVTGVTEKLPDNTHIHFDYLLSMPTNPNVKRFEWSWIWTQVVTYIKLRPDTDVKAFNSKLKTFAERHAPNTFKILGMDYDEFINEKGGWFVYLQPVQSIYLDPDRVGNRFEGVGDIKYLYILSFVSLFILLIAVINFVNLSTARSATRAKEVGVKKTLGLMRGSLIAQFQVEHIIITLISVIMGVGLMEILRSLVQPLTDISIPSLWNLPFILTVCALPFVIGFLAGIYPSFYLTSFTPAQVLKGKVASGFRSSGLRNALVVLQFAISVGFMAATIIVFQQLDYFQSADLGLDKENLMIVSNAEKLGDQLDSFRDEVAQIPGVVSASRSMDIRNGYEDIFMREGDDKKMTISSYKADEHFFETTKIGLLAGRTFDANRPSDVDAVVINGTTAKLLGWTPEEALGKHILYGAEKRVSFEGGTSLEIIGVARDFHIQSLRQNITPIMFMNINSSFWGDGRIVSIKFATKETSKLVAAVTEKWNQRTAATPITISFYDEEVKQQYQQEQRLGSLFSIFTGLSIIIAVIGLVGLVAYSAEMRKKELGVRKVFGASTSRLVMMMNSQYIKLIILSLVIATPVTWWFLQLWLDTFAYKITINPLVFVLAGMAELMLALVSVGYLSMRAASQNPTLSLKEE